MESKTIKINSDLYERLVREAKAQRYSSITDFLEEFLEQALPQEVSEEEEPSGRENLFGAFGKRDLNEAFGGVFKDIFKGGKP
jgi:hypothetical protein